MAGGRDAADAGANFGDDHLRALVTDPQQANRLSKMGKIALTEASLMFASSSVFCRCCTWLASSRTNFLRVRNSDLTHCVAGSGTKLARINPCARKSGRAFL
jgi:hypothetical protein